MATSKPAQLSLEDVSEERLCGFLMNALPPHSSHGVSTCSWESLGQESPKHSTLTLLAPSPWQDFGSSSSSRYGPASGLVAPELFM